ncbi:HD domain-containing protein [Candidatus Beckwithbacteria bacterium]|nr:HD domain-containing protein [Candidatus Beckwithbacteria bacterium]
MKDRVNPGLPEAIRRHDPEILQHLQTENSHGIPHAQETADLTFAIAQEPEYAKRTNTDDLIVLREAGLLHDLGYTANKYGYWSGTQEEHPIESAAMALAILKNLEYYKDHPEKLGQVLWLIYNHDNTNYIFPAFWLFEQKYLERTAPGTAIPRLLPGRIRTLPDYFKNAIGEANTPNVTKIDDPLLNLLKILQEADSRLGSAERTLAYCDKRGVPRFGNEGGVMGIGDLWWQGSAAANIILALNRALLDAHTRSGQEIAKQIYRQGFTFVEQLYKKEAMANPSILRLESGFLPFAQLKDEDIELIFQRGDRERWANTATDQTYFQLVRNLGNTKEVLQEKFQKHISRLTSRLIPLSSINPNGSNLDNDYQRQKLLSLQEIRKEIIKAYALDIFTQLPGMAEVSVFEYDLVLGNQNHSYILEPPIISIHDLRGSNHPPYNLLSGHNWVYQARKAGLEHVRVLFAQM